MGFAFQVTFDCRDPDGMSSFWAALLHYQLQPPPDGYDTWDAFLDSIGMPQEERGKLSAVTDPDGRGARLLFQKVPEAKAVKNRVHLDVNVGGGFGVAMPERKVTVEAEVQRAIGLGATLVDRHDTGHEYWVTLRDPEGNEFCLQ